MQYILTSNTIHKEERFMKRNPLIPFAVIAALGILFMIVIGIWGGKAVQEAAKKPSTQQVATPDKIFEQNCAACHGNNLQGGMGPNLQHIGGSWSKDKILNQIQNGGGGMPPGVIKGAEAEKVADWLSKKK
jgi:mono/diheme cytochrome c family protein